MDKKISICMTLKNRAHFLEYKFKNILLQQYNPKDIEICITDGYSTDNILEILEKWSKYFYQIKYAISDRNVLPFKAASNCPACDRNALVCSLPSFEKIILTDAEVLWTTNNELNWISEQLEDKNVVIGYPNYYLLDNINYVIDSNILPNKSVYGKYRGAINGAYNGLCNAINKSTFIQNKGYDERFMLGFAVEDYYFLKWYENNKKFVASPNEVLHLWHDSPYTPQNMKLCNEYSKPLAVKLLETNEFPNNNNPHWQRPNMIKNNIIFKENESNVKIDNFQTFERTPIQDLNYNMSNLNNMSNRSYTHGLTVQSVIIDEPFIWYSIKSLYDCADKILLYDTGSTNETCIEGINKLLREDVNHKIIFKRIKIDTNEKIWNYNNVHQQIKDNKNKRSVGWVRKLQIQDTYTDFFILLDGDEVHYESSINKIRNIIDRWNNSKICGFIPLVWLLNMNQAFNNYSPTGRIFKTDSVWLNDDSPWEMHIYTRTKEIIDPNKSFSISYNELEPYAHFETYLKPFRRVVSKERIYNFNGELPKIMKENPYFMSKISKKDSIIKTVFDDIYSKRKWIYNDKCESISGEGSTLASTGLVRKEVSRILNQFNIRTLVDGACGDFNWMKEIIKSNTNINYIGCDIVEDLIKSNIEKYATNNINFQCLDITKDILPEGDLIIVRDCLGHLSEEDVFKFIKNLKRSNIKYLLTTTFLNFENKNINTGEWRPICLTKSPFNFSSYIELVSEGCVENNGIYKDKSLILYEVSKL